MSNKQDSLPRGMTRVVLSLQLQRGRGKPSEKLTVRFAPQVPTDGGAKYSRLSEMFFDAVKKESP